MVGAGEMEDRRGARRGDSDKGEHRAKDWAGVGRGDCGSKGERA
jgi:hypothetical protein